MKTPLVVILALLLGLGVVSFTIAEMIPKATEGQSCCMMGPDTMRMMGGGQMRQMLPMMEMMQACTKMMQQMSTMMGQPGTPQQPPPQPEKK